jgi:hypothetical protein
LIAIRTTNVPDELKNALETDYLALAYFIKDDKAKLMTQDEIDALLRFDELKSELKLNTLLKEMDKQSTTNIKKLVNAHEIFGQVIREENTLSQELGELKRQYNLK